VILALCSFASACGGGKPAPSASNNAAAKSDADEHAKDGDAGSGDERPFAGSAAEATTLISAVVDKKGSEIGACVREFRVRKKLARERVSVSFGIDMEGRLLGVTSKGKEDDELKACVQRALEGAPFPRSHAGVITITKTYQELLQ
jgi:hypothetical protein